MRILAENRDENYKVIQVTDYEWYFLKRLKEHAIGDDRYTEITGDLGNIEIWGKTLLTCMFALDKLRTTIQVLKNVEKDLIDLEDAK